MFMETLNLCHKIRTIETLRARVKRLKKAASESKTKSVVQVTPALPSKPQPVDSPVSVSDHEKAQQKELAGVYCFLNCPALFTPSY